MACSIRPWILLNCISLTTGPIVTPSSFGSPTFTWAAADFAISTTSSWRDAGTNIRVGALHDWPEFMKQLCTPCATALLKSASSRMMLADLPPSSCATRFTVSAEDFATIIPARVEPVNDIMSMSGWRDITSPTFRPSPFTRLKTPAGTPASSRISANRAALSGATSDGFKTMVQPAARAGATLQAIWLIGQFHGVIKPHTPTGSLTIIVPPFSACHSKPAKISRVVDRWAIPIAACAAFDSHAGAPISEVMVSATSPIRRWYTAMIESSRSRRSCTLVRENVSNAFFAAATALFTSVSLPIIIWPMTCSLAGLITSNGFGSVGSTHAPSI